MSTQENTPELWADRIPQPGPQDHKYTRGQVVVLGGEEMTGAACLAADAAARSGAGLVTILARKRSILQALNPNETDPLPVYKSFRPSIIARRPSDPAAYIETARKKGRVAGVIGPGLGSRHAPQTRRLIIKLLGEGKDAPLLIDADGINALAGEPHSARLCAALHPQAVLTPHEGEFKRLFPDLAETLKKDRQAAAAQAAALISGAVLVLKGHQTLIARTGHSAAEMLVNTVSSPHLATAGSGDVLSGLIAGLMAQGIPAFQAAAAGVWVHGKAAQNLGAGLVAEDLTKNIPQVLKEMLGI